MSIPFPQNFNEIPQYLYRKGDFIFKPYDLVQDANGNLLLICGRIHISPETILENEIFDKIAISLFEFIEQDMVNPENNYFAISPYSSLKVLLDEANLNNGRTFFSQSFSAITPQNITEFSQQLNS